jgi:type II secretory pathway pseudopilin PulG
MRRNEGFTILMLLVAVSVLAVGLLVAVPVWQTQIQRENEDELIFRGNQYVEAIRRYQTKNPGQFPQTLEELYKKRFLRRLFPDPMTKQGRWDIIIQDVRLSPAPGGRQPSGTSGGRMQLLVVPQASIGAFSSPRILGVVSSSNRMSFRLYNDEDVYNKWYFYYGRDPKGKADIKVYGESERP